MANEILSYYEMCQRERLSLQRGMNYRPCGKDYSIILMSLRPNAPYEDEIQDDGGTLIYEGHDAQRTALSPKPKQMDQPEFLPSGKLTENGKFKRAVEEWKSGLCRPELVHVYEKIRDGIWSFNGGFDLVDARVLQSGNRLVFKFKLTIRADDQLDSTLPIDLPHQRLIPSHVKQDVWKRDGGKCVLCSETTHLHFDHVIPFSKGGSSLTAANIQLLCSRHNLEKRDRIV
jgi:hypothetical protein